MVDEPQQHESSEQDRPGFREELERIWRSLPNKGVFLIPLVAWIALFHWLGNSTFGYIDTGSLFHWMINSYNSSYNEDDHGFLIPFIVLGLMWWKRERLLAVRKEAWWPGLLILAVSAVLHFIGYLVQQPRLSIVGFFGGVYGLMGQAWGLAFLRASFFPFVLFAFMVPVGSLATALTFPLRMIVTTLSVGFTHFVLNVDVYREGSLIFNADRTYQYDVAPACSGIRSLVSLILLTTIYGVLTFEKLWKRWLVVLMSLPLAVLGNTTRIVCVIIAGEAFGEEAGKKIEQNLGFITFAIAIVCILAMGRWLREETPTAPLEKTS